MSRDQRRTGLSQSCAVTTFSVCVATAHPKPAGTTSLPAGGPRILGPLQACKTGTRNITPSALCQVTPPVSHRALRSHPSLGLQLVGASSHEECFWTGGGPRLPAPDSTLTKIRLGFQKHKVLRHCGLPFALSTDSVSQAVSPLGQSRRVQPRPWRAPLSGGRHTDG